MLTLRSGVSIRVILHVTSWALSTTTVTTPSAVELEIPAIWMILTALLVFACFGVLSGVANQTWWLRTDGAGNTVRRIIDIEFLVDVLWNRLDFCSQFLLNLIQIEAIVPVDKVDCKTQVPKTSRAADSVKVGLSIFGEIEVNDNIDSLDINTASQQIRADKVSANAIPEIVEDAVAVMLKHSSMGVEA